jgi:hypothetical protein
MSLSPQMSTRLTLQCRLDLAFSGTYIYHKIKVSHLLHIVIEVILVGTFNHSFSTILKLTAVDQIGSFTFQSYPLEFWKAHHPLAL